MPGGAYTHAVEFTPPPQDTDAKGRSYPFNVILNELEARLTVDLAERDERAVETALLKTWLLAQFAEKKRMQERLDKRGITIRHTGTWDWNVFDAWEAAYGGEPRRQDARSDAEGA